MTDRREAFELHTHHWQRCRMCPIGRWAFKHCFGQGHINAPFVFIGEGPGASEDALGIPFVGPAGRLLQKALGLAGFATEDWFLTNLVACRPTDKQGGANRAPSPNEVANCSERLTQVVHIIRPRIIVAVGSVPASYLLNNVGRFDGFQTRYEKIRHPAWILRQGGERSEAWCDFVDSLKTIRRIK